MVVLLTKSSVKEARKCKVSERALFDAVQRARNGMVDAQLGATLVKQEVARPPEGRKTACRAIIAMRQGTDLAVVMHVYAKSKKSDLSPRESDAYVELSRTIVALTDGQISGLLRSQGWKVIGDGQLEG